MNNIIKNSSLKDIKSNIDNYINLFLENGLLIFPKINLNEQDQDQIMQLFGQRLNWGYITQSQSEDHLVTFNRYTKNVSSNEIFIEWHLEHVERAKPQVATSWRMTKFICPHKSGSTGFIDACTVYSNLKDEWKSFLDNCFLKKISDSSTERLCVIEHRNSNKKILRLDPYQNEEVLFKVGINQPSKDDIDLFKEIKDWFFNEIVEKESNALWWDWSEGDFILVDLSRMIHAVKGGFLLGQRSFTRHWAYRDKADYNLYNKSMFYEGANLG